MPKANQHISKTALIAENKQLRAQLRDAQQRIEQLENELKELKRLIFGKKSERFEVTELPGQPAVDLQGEVVAIAEQPAQGEPVRGEGKKKTGAARRPLPEHLPRTQIIIEPQEDTTGMVCIGEEVTEILAKQPSTFFVIQIIRKKWAKADGSGVVIGKMPSRAIEKGIAHESLLAYILVSKFVDHQPLYRLLEIFSRQGVNIASSTINDWVGACCKLLQPLYEALKKELLLNEYLQVDESPIQVLDKSKKGNTHRGYHWLYLSKDQQLVLFDYQKGRGRDGPKQMLKDFKGYLQTDGYSVYEDFAKNPNITLLSCMAHARRYFDQAKDNDPQRAAYFLAQVQLLYQIEAGLREQNADWDTRLQGRQKLALPVVEHLGQWLKAEYPKVLPKSAIGKAIHYSLKRWHLLCRYTEHGGLEIDNNLIENQIRPLALGRKNYLFAGSHQGAQNAAIIYSLLGSCKLNGLDPFQWLFAVLDKLPDYPISKIADLLPCHVRFEKPTATSTPVSAKL